MYQNTNHRWQIWVDQCWESSMPSLLKSLHQESQTGTSLSKATIETREWLSKMLPRTQWWHSCFEIEGMSDKWTRQWRQTWQELTKEQCFLPLVLCSHLGPRASKLGLWRWTPEEDRLQLGTKLSMIFEDTLPSCHILLHHMLVHKVLTTHSPFLTAIVISQNNKFESLSKASYCKFVIAIVTQRQYSFIQKVTSVHHT